MTEVTKKDLAPNIRGDREYVQHAPFSVEVEHPSSFASNKTFTRKDFIQLDSLENICNYVKKHTGIKENINHLQNILENRNFDVYISGQSVQRTNYAKSQMHYLDIHVIVKDEYASVCDKAIAYKKENNLFFKIKNPDEVQKMVLEIDQRRPHILQKYGRKGIGIEFIDKDKKEKLFEREFKHYKTTYKDANSEKTKKMVEFEKAIFNGLRLQIPQVSIVGSAKAKQL
jgi:hypothetical protein